MEIYLIQNRLFSDICPNLPTHWNSFAAERTACLYKRSQFMSILATFQSWKLDDFINEFKELTDVEQNMQHNTIERPCFQTKHYNFKCFSLVSLSTVSILPLIAPLKANMPDIWAALGACHRHLALLRRMSRHRRPWNVRWWLFMSTAHGFLHMKQ